MDFENKLLIIFVINLIFNLFVFFRMDKHYGSILKTLKLSVDVSRDLNKENKTLHEENKRLRIIK